MKAESYITRYMNAKSTSSVNEFMAFVRERERIRKRKEAGQPWPWTRDETLKHYHFCNIDREHDSVTIEVMSILKKTRTAAALVFNAIIARFFNQPATLKGLGVIEPRTYDWAATYEKLCAIRSRHGIIWRRAYLLTPKFDGIDTGDKAKNYALLLTSLAEWSVAHASRLLRAKDVQTAVAMLTPLRGFGTFMATQVVLDLALTGRAAFKTTDYVQLPYTRGARWGLSDIYGCTTYADAVRQLEALKKKTGLTYAQTEQALCEFSRYLRLRDGRSSNLRTYQPK